MSTATEPRTSRDDGMKPSAPDVSGLPPLLTVPEVAEFARISVTTAWSAVNSGRLPAVRVGGHNVLVRREDVPELFTPYIPKPRRATDARKSARGGT